jgi:hypothetical protein
MTLTKKHLVISVLVLSAILFTLPLVFKVNLAFGSNSSPSTPACTASSSRMIVGNQASTQILDARGRRSYALIQQPLNATNTVAVSITSSAPAFGSGISLANATTSIYETSLEVGLNTDLAYTGAVSVLTSTGSSTLQVTECIY